MTSKILITGENSYVGTSFSSWMETNQPQVEVDTISVRGNEWETLDFSSYQTILHVAGIAHVNSKVFTDDDYYNVNTKLAVKVAEKAKIDGVSQFIFMSSIIVYNDSEINNGVITKETVPYSKNAYGDSKIQAELGLEQFQSDNFEISILRPPMIYGPNSKGNFPRLSKLAKKTPIFPNYQNERSMLFIDNLCSYIYNISVEKQSGVFFPQNSEPVCTSHLVETIAKIHGKKVVFTKLFNPFIKLLSKVNTINKVFGNLTYSPELLNGDVLASNNICFDKTVELTEVPDV